MDWGLSVTSLDEVKKLLDGKVDPEGLEINSELYEMAESIYGREALEQMGIDAPARPTDSIVQPNGNAKHEVQMPLEPIPQPEIPPPKPKKNKGQRTKAIQVLAPPSFGTCRASTFPNLLHSSRISSRISAYLRKNMSVNVTPQATNDLRLLARGRHETHHKAAHSCSSFIAASVTAFASRRQLVGVVDPDNATGVTFS